MSGDLFEVTIAYKETKDVSLSVLVDNGNKQLGNTKQKINLIVYDVVCVISYRPSTFA